MDDRRLLLKSLTVPTYELQSDGQIDSSGVPVFDDSDGMERSSYFVDVSAEEEYMTDVLDALAARQPQQGRGVAHVPRAWFAGPAEIFSGSKVKLGQLRILRSRMFIPLKCLLITQSKTPGTAIEHFGKHVPEFERRTSCIRHDFLAAETTGTSWPVLGMQLWVYAQCSVRDRVRRHFCGGLGLETKDVNKIQCGQLLIGDKEKNVGVRGNIT